MSNIDFDALFDVQPEGVKPKAKQPGQIDFDALFGVGAQTQSEPSTLDRLKQGATNTMDYGRAALAAESDGPDAVAKIVASNRKTAIPQSAAGKRMQEEIAPAAKAYEESSGLDAVGKFASLAAKRVSQFFSNPGEFVGTVAESLPNSAPGLAGGVAGAVGGSAVAGPVGAAVGGVAGGTAGGYLVEQGAALFDQIQKEAQKRGIDPADEVALAPLVREKFDEFVKASRLKGVGTAGTDAILNTLTMGVAGAAERALAKEARSITSGVKAGSVGAKEGAEQLAAIQARQAARTTLPARVKRGGAIAAAEAGGEGLSEAAGQKLAYGEVDGLEVVDEMIVGAGQGAGMAAGRGAINKVTGSVASDNVDSAIQEAGGAIRAAKPAAPAATAPQQQAPTQTQSSLLAQSAFADVAGDESALADQQKNKAAIALSLQQIAAYDGEQGLVQAIQSMSGGDNSLAEALYASSQDQALVEAGRQLMRQDTVRFVEVNDLIRTESGIADGVAAPAMNTQGQQPAPVAEVVPGSVPLVKQGLVNGTIIDQAQASTEDLTGLAIADQVMSPDGRTVVVVARDDQTAQQLAQLVMSQGIEAAQSAITPTQGKAVVQQIDPETGQVAGEQVVAPEEVVGGSVDTTRIRPVMDVLAERIQAPQAQEQQSPQAPQPKFFARKSSKPVAAVQPSTSVGATDRTAALIDGINSGWGLSGDRALRADSVQEVKPGRELFRMAKAFKAAFGVDVVFVSAPNGLVQQNGEVFNNFDGIADPNTGTIYLNEKANVPLNILGHELSHILEAQYPDLFEAVELAVLSRMRAPAARKLRDSLMEAVSREGDQSKAASTIRKELVAEGIGEMAEDTAFWADIFSEIGQDETLAKKLYQLVLDVIAKLQRALTNSGYIQGNRDIADVKKAVASAYKEWAQRYAMTGGNQDNLTPDEYESLKQFQKLGKVTEKTKPEPAPKQPKEQAEKPFAQTESEPKTPAQVKARSGFKEDDAGIEFARDIKTTGQLLKLLTPAEAAKVKSAAAAKIFAQLESLPDAKEMAAVAYAGRAKRGWYQQSAEMIRDVFGFDGPRFAALLAATSPQCSVETNLLNALNIWKNWVASGRPTDREAIIDVMARSVQGNKGRDSVLNAWINNSVRALSMDDVENAILSGPKVNSFYRNLIGVSVEVTNDAWMANYAAVDQEMFSGALNKLGTDPGKGSGYLAMNAQVREAARRLTKLTGETWTPAEVQETIWSWAKTLYEMADSKNEKRSAEQLVKQGAVTDELINATPDFGTLFYDQAYAGILQEAGYGQRLEEIRSRARSAGAGAAQVAASGGQAAPFAVDTQRRLEAQAARRLDALRKQRRSPDARGEGGAAVEVAVDSRTQPGVRGTSLEGLADTVRVDGRLIKFGGFKPAQQAARRYMAKAGLKYDPPKKYVKVDQDRARRIAAEFDAMSHNPSDPEVKAAYDAMIKETVAQWQEIKATGLKVEFITGDDPYGNPRNAILDVVQNNHLWVFPTSAGFGGTESANVDISGNPLEAIVPGETISGRPVQVNDIFRIVHDYFGHIKEGVGFRADGEENAWRMHMAMYSPLARRAATTETRGQNSWVNFGPFAERNKTANGAETQYAPQKIGILPQWVSDDGRSDSPIAFARKLNPNREENLRRFKDGSKEQGIWYHGTARNIREFRAKQAGAIFVTPRPSFAEGFANSSAYYMADKGINALEGAERVTLLDRLVGRIKKEYPGSGFAYERGQMLQRALEWSNGEGQLDGELLNMAMEEGRDLLNYGENIMPLYVRATNPFDYEDREQVEAVVDRAILDEGFSQEDREPFIEGVMRGSWDVIEEDYMQRAVKALGHDGFYVKEDGVKNLAVYKSNQLKSAIGNNGDFDMSNPDISFARNPTKLYSYQEIKQSLQNGKLELSLSDSIQRERWADAYLKAKNPTERKGLMRQIGDYLIDKFADSRIALSRWIESLPMDPRLKQRLEGDIRRSDSIRADLQGDVEQQFVEPMMAAITKASRATKLKSDEVKKWAGHWMSARYAPEANQRLIAKDRAALLTAQASGEPQKIAQAQQDLNDRILAVNGAIGAARNRGVAGGLNDAEAADMVSDIESKIPVAMLEEIARPIYAMMQWRTQQDLKSGKVTQAIVNGWLNSPRYVPLTGDPRATPETNDLFSSGGQINQDKDHAMNGRKESIADDGIDAAFEAILKTINFAAIQDFKVTLDKVFWEAKNAGIDIGLSREPATAMNTDNAVVLRRINTQPNGYGVQQAFAFTFRDQAISDAIKKDNIEVTNWMLTKLQTPTRWYARMVTQFMPLFAPINLVRDIWERSELLRTRKIYDVAGNEINVDRVARKAIAGTFDHENWQASAMKAFRRGGMTAARGELEEMIRLGGSSTTGSYLDRSAGGLEATIRQDAGRAGHLANKLMHGADSGPAKGVGVQSWNDFFEVIPSLAIYRALKAEGVAAKDAAAATLDLMNFHKKGSSMPAIRALYIFAQPAATSGYNLAKYLATPKGRARFAAQVLIASGLYALLAATWGDDDDEELGNKLDNLSNYTVERSIPVKLGDYVLKLPIGFGPPQLAQVAGVTLNRVASGRYSVTDGLGEIAKGWAKSFAPIAPSELEITKRPVDFLTQTFTPTILRPLMQIATDQNAMGGPLTPVFKNPEKMRSDQAQRTTPGVYVSVAKEVEDMLGVDIYPDQIRALVDGYLVGPAKSITAMMIDNPAKVQRGEPERVPLVGQIIDVINDRAMVNSIYNRVRTDMDSAHRKVKSLTESGRAGEITDEMRQLDKLHQSFKVGETMISSQRAALRRLSLDEETMAEKVQAVESRAEAERRRLLVKYFQSVK